MLNPDHENWLALIPAGASPDDQKALLFMIASTWADRIKGNPAYHNDGSHGGNRPPTDGTAGNNSGYDDLARHKYWHFIDVPFATDATTLPAVPLPNAQTQIVEFRKVLASGNADKLKSYDLTWLLHLVGDIHQPLHSTTRVSAAQPEGDDGGNGVKLVGSPNNLHSLWDGLLGNDNSPQSAKEASAALPVAPANAVADLNVQHWISEGFIMSKNDVYRDPPIGTGVGPFTLTAAYLDSARQLAEKRVALAGARLARILNHELK
jgi:hypothetical protein